MCLSSMNLLLIGSLRYTNRPSIATNGASNRKRMLVNQADLTNLETHYGTRTMQYQRPRYRP